MDTHLGPLQDRIFLNMLLQMNPGGSETSFENVEDDLKKRGDLKSAPVAT